jgi:hypothetical protein
MATTKLSMPSIILAILGFFNLGIAALIYSQFLLLMGPLPGVYFPLCSNRLPAPLGATLAGDLDDESDGHMPGRGVIRSYERPRVS